MGTPQNLPGTTQTPLRTPKLPWDPWGLPQNPPVSPQPSAFEERAVAKVDDLLESYMGIRDSELGEPPKSWGPSRDHPRAPPNCPNSPKCPRLCSGVTLGQRGGETPGTPLKIPWDPPRTLPRTSPKLLEPPSPRGAPKPPGIFPDIPDVPMCPMSPVRDITVSMSPQPPPWWSWAVIRGTQTCCLCPKCPNVPNVPCPSYPHVPEVPSP